MKKCSFYKGMFSENYLYKKGRLVLITSVADVFTGDSALLLYYYYINLFKMTK